MKLDKYLSKKISGVRTFSAQETQQILSKSSCFLAFLYNEKYSNRTISSETIMHIMKNVVKKTYHNVTLYLDYLGEEGYKAGEFCISHFFAIVYNFVSVHCIQ